MSLKTHLEKTMGSLEPIKLVLLVPPLQPNGNSCSSTTLEIASCCIFVDLRNKFVDFFKLQTEWLQERYKKYQLFGVIVSAGPVEVIKKLVWATLKNWFGS